MDDIITTKGRIFMEGRRATGRTTSWKSEVKKCQIASQSSYNRPFHLRVLRSVACFIVNKIEEIIISKSADKTRTF